MASPLLGLTLEQIDQAELDSGVSTLRRGDARSMRRFLSALLGDDIAESTVAELNAALDPDGDLPVTFEDGVPTDGGRASDRWVVVCAKAFGWPPTVTRQQTLRDLHLLNAAQEASE